MDDGKKRADIAEHTKRYQELGERHVDRLRNGTGLSREQVIENKKADDKMQGMDMSSDQGVIEERRQGVSLNREQEVIEEADGSAAVRLLRERMEQAKQASHTNKFKQNDGKWRGFE